MEDRTSSECSSISRSNSSDFKASMEGENIDRAHAQWLLSRNEEYHATECH